MIHVQPAKIPLPQAAKPDAVAAQVSEVAVPQQFAELMSGQDPELSGFSNGTPDNERAALPAVDTETAPDLPDWVPQEQDADQTQKHATPPHDLGVEQFKDARPAKDHWAWRYVQVSSERDPKATIDTTDRAAIMVTDRREMSGIDADVHGANLKGAPQSPPMQAKPAHAAMLALSRVEKGRDSTPRFEGREIRHATQQEEKATMGAPSRRVGPVALPLPLVNPALQQRIFWSEGGVRSIGADQSLNIDHAMQTASAGFMRAEPPGPLSIAPPVHASPSAVLPQLSQAIVGATQKRFEIELSPKELGKVRIALDPKEAGLHVILIAERPETLELMRRHAADLLRDLSMLGLGDIDLQFGERSQEKDRDGPDGMSFSADHDSPSENLQSSVTDLARGGMDVRL